MVQPERQRRDPEATQRNILDVAAEEFAERGYDGARVDEIANLTRTSKRMIYYYFQSKERLYQRVMEEAYRVIRELEQQLDVSTMPPVDALRHLAEATYDHHTSHRAFVRLVAIENIHHARHIEGSPVIADLNATAIKTVAQVLRRGVSSGVFRDDIDALDVHMLISSLPIFCVANRATFRALFGRDLLDANLHDHHRKLAGDVVVNAVRR